MKDRSSAERTGWTDVSRRTTGIRALLALSVWTVTLLAGGWHHGIVSRRGTG